MTKLLTGLGCILAAASIQFTPLAAVASDQGDSRSCAIADTPASVVFAAEPIMPEIARDLWLSGTTQVRVDLDAAGAVIGASVYRSSGSWMLDAAALAATRASRFAPTVHECAPIAGSYLYTVEFVQ